MFERDGKNILTFEARFLVLQKVDHENFSWKVYPLPIALKWTIT